MRRSTHQPHRRRHTGTVASAPGRPATTVGTATKTETPRTPANGADEGNALGLTAAPHRRVLAAIKRGAHHRVQVAGCTNSGASATRHADAYPTWLGRASFPRSDSPAHPPPVKGSLRRYAPLTGSSSRLQPAAMGTTPRSGPEPTGHQRVVLLLQVKNPRTLARHSWRMPETTTALSITALVLSSASLGWQALSHFLVGSRCRIRLREGASQLPGRPAGKDILLTSGPCRALMLDPDRASTQSLTVAEVINRGRTPVQILRVALVDKHGNQIRAWRESTVELPHVLGPGETALLGTYTRLFRTGAPDAPPIGPIEYPMSAMAELGNGRRVYSQPLLGRMWRRARLQHRMRPAMVNADVD